MKLKKGFTLTEVLAVIVILGMVTAITTMVIANILNDSKKKAFTDSVYAAMNAYTNNESYEYFNDQGEMNVTDLPLDHNDFISGTVKRNDNNEVEVTNITNGNYCANGTRNNLEVQEGNCE